MEKKGIFNKIAEALLQDYTSVYYVNAVTNEYYWYSNNSGYSSLKLEPKGEDFFVNIVRDAKQVVHEDDLHIFTEEFQKDKLVAQMKKGEMQKIEYRLMIDGKPVYHTLRLIRGAGEGHDYFIIGVLNIDKEVRQRIQEEEEKKRTQEENSKAQEIARRDELTGIRNKFAYKEHIDTLQERIDAGEEPQFAIAVFDINGLKATNDTLGHRAGDELIKASCKLICNTFRHSPVFRIGGDEFVAILMGEDFIDRKDIIHRFQAIVEGNIVSGKTPVVAVGASSVRVELDKNISDVFERADALMYENKSNLKVKETNKVIVDSNGTEKHTIPDDRRVKLDTLFKAFSSVADDVYVYLCDMRYDLSRWSSTAVELFGLPSEYMYAAGDIWETRIHPDDKEVYHAGIKDIFNGIYNSHDMQYRARKVNGDYDVCTCHGMVLRDEKDNPDYFVGTIRNHGMHSQVDTLTGLRNLYGFMEDIRMNLRKEQEMEITLIGISKFSEINEIYGYNFGNRILQQFARHLYETVGNTGAVYRLDGTKFAIAGFTYSSDEVRERYARLRNHFRKGYIVDGRNIILDLNAGHITVDNFSVDDQTIYSCLNFAYTESKSKMQGDMFEFYNNLNDENKHRLEKLHEIRGSILKDYKGFYLLYQPVVDSNNEKIIGAEALLRWKNDKYGVVPPDHFIPMLEKDPLFPQLGKWILQTAIDAAKIVLKSNPDFMINVNLSYTQMEKPDFVDMVLEVLEQSEFPAEHLCLEMTERCRLLDINLLKNVVVNLRGHGVKIALDDFGTGFSSVGVIKFLPFDIIKIDRTFVRRIEEDELEQKLIQNFVNVASTFGAKVCVEGIETEGMKDILKTYNVQSFQGYFYSKPMELADFLELNFEKMLKQDTRI